MTTIFISGSRSLGFLPDEFKQRIERIIEKGYDIVIGDSEKGVDALTIRYLTECQYNHVAVYTTHDKPRLEGLPDCWKVHVEQPGSEPKFDSAGQVRNARERETAKDKAMAVVSDYGLVAWQSCALNRFRTLSASKGSLRNMYQLLLDDKPVILYKAREETPEEFRCLELRTVDDLGDVVNECPDVVKKVYKVIVERNAQSHLPLGETGALG